MSARSVGEDCTEYGRCGAVWDPAYTEDWSNRQREVLISANHQLRLASNCTCDLATPLGGPQVDRDISKVFS